MAAAYRSPLPALGLSAPSVAPPVQAGVQSILAFWLGGASAASAAVVVPVALPVPSGAGGPARYVRFRKEQEISTVDEDDVLEFLQVWTLWYDRQ